jgi:hypothetical protein
MVDGDGILSNSDTNLSLNIASMLCSLIVELPSTALHSAAPRYLLMCLPTGAPKVTTLLGCPRYPRAAADVSPPCRDAEEQVVRSIVRSRHRLDVEDDASHLVSCPIFLHTCFLLRPPFFGIRASHNERSSLSLILMFCGVMLGQVRVVKKVFPEYIVSI